jgi:hypothetical protein
MVVFRSAFRKAQVERYNWQEKVRSVLYSPDPFMREHVYVGEHALDGHPLFVHNPILGRHLLACGHTGGGKTSLGLVPLIIQRLRRKNSGALVVIDLKGEPFLFHTVRTEAERSGRTFKFFTYEQGKATFGFNPWQGKDRRHISIRRIVETFIKALDLQHGSGYGKAFYTREARAWLLKTIIYRRVRSFEELRVFAEEVKGKERENIGELLDVIESLATLPQLNITQGQTNRQVVDNAIVMKDVVENGQVVYFYLPAEEEQTAAELGKIAVHDLFQAADGKHPVICVIDEFQRIVGHNIEDVLNQARSKLLSLWLANQTISSLKNSDGDLRHVVWTNAHLKLIFSVPDPQGQEYVDQAIGDQTLITKPEGHKTRVPLFGPGGYRELGSNHFFMVAHVIEDSGLTQWKGYPMPVIVEHTMQTPEFKERERAPWPSAKDYKGAAVFDEGTPPPHKEPSQRSAPASPSPKEEPRDEDDQDDEDGPSMSERLRRFKEQNEEGLG